MLAKVHFVAQDSANINLFIDGLQSLTIRGLHMKIRSLVISYFFPIIAWFANFVLYHRIWAIGQLMNM